MKTSSLHYTLPEGFIATCPVSPRSSAKMLVVDNGEFRHATVDMLLDELHGDELLVFNETAVLPARIQGRKTGTGGRIEGLFLEQDNEGNWLMMLKSNGKLPVGSELEIGCGITLKIKSRNEEVWCCSCSDLSDPSKLLAEVGSTPLPPYILAARKGQVVEDYVDRLAYQTVYADASQCRSVAAPTAGLHFDDSLLDAIDLKGIERTAVTLHVGIGTFRPIETESVEKHRMHFEHWSVEAPVLQRIAQAKESGRPIVAIGTTTVRTLESLPEPDSWPSHGTLSGNTNLLISPPYEFRFVNGLLTNFHLPNSTLLALVAALVDVEQLKSAYAEAIERKYRFYSYGDAMFIPPSRKA